MVRTALVAAVTLLLTAGTLSSGTARESPLAQAEQTPLPPQAGEDVATSTSTALATSTEVDALDGPGVDIPFVIVAPKSKVQPAAPPAEPDYPVRISIPSISLNDPIEGVGVNGKGEMEVPSGSTNNIGWYKDGTVPGNLGSAVLDAHVFAALKNLKYVKVGSSIYVIMASGRKLHFKVEASMLYKLADVPLDYLFNRSDNAYLNLITCAGHLTPDHSTYDHRLIVYARLAN